MEQAAICRLIGDYYPLHKIGKRWFWWSHLAWTGDIWLCRQSHPRTSCAGNDPIVLKA